MQSFIKNKICPVCTKSFYVNLKNKRSAKKICCSRKCSGFKNGSARLGSKHSDAHKLFLSKRLSGKNNPFFGKSHNVESLLKMSTNSRWEESRLNHITIDKNQHEILDGLLLSDGCLSECSRVSSRLTFGFKYKETCMDIFSDLNSFEFSPIWENKKQKSYHSKSKFYPELLTEHNRWYKNGKKIVPPDLLLSKLSCYWWFVGDGYVNKGNVIFCTDSFSVVEIYYLINSLNDLGFKSKKRKSQNRIIITKNDCEKFLKWIYRDNSQYKYKWDNYCSQINREIIWQ